VFREKAQSASSKPATSGLGLRRVANSGGIVVHIKRVLLEMSSADREVAHLGPSLVVIVKAEAAALITTVAMSVPLASPFAVVC